MRKQATADIYVIVCVPTNKVYVGSSNNGKFRLKNHWLSLAGQRHENPYLQRAWNKHGAGNFTWYIAEKCSLTERWVREQWWIDHLGACNRSSGFNSMHSVTKSVPSSIMSKQLKAYWAIRWKDAEYREARTQQLRQISQNPETKAKMQEAKRANWQDPVYRAKQIASYKQGASKNRKANSERVKALWRDPEYRAKQTAERAARFKDPAFRAKLSEAAKNRRTCS